MPWSCSGRKRIRQGGGKMSSVASALAAAKTGYKIYHGAKLAYNVGKVLKSNPVVRKIGGKIKHVAKVGKAAVQLKARVSNPKNQVKFVSDAVRGKGFVLPGSKYIGPGNEMNKGKPVDRADANAYQHDVDYDNYIKKGVSKRKVYTGWSDADARLLKNTKATTPNGLAVNLGMGAKKLAYKAGLTSRIRDSDVYGEQ